MVDVTLVVVVFLLAGLVKGVAGFGSPTVSIALFLACAAVAAFLAVRAFG
mgnify:CR=1 FL=1